MTFPIFFYTTFFHIFEISTMQVEQNTQDTNLPKTTVKNASKPTYKKNYKKTDRPINKTKKKPQRKLTPSKARGFRCYNRCKEIWGNLFDLKKIKPFSIGIRNELIDDAAKRGIEISPSVIYTGLYWVANTYFYQKSLSKGGSRFDMNGNKTTEITEDQIKFAIDKSQQIKNARKKTCKKTLVRNGKRPFVKNKPQSNGSFQKRIESNVVQNKTKN